MSHQNLRWLAGHALSAGAVCALAWLCPFFARHFGEYWAFSFWLVLALDALHEDTVNVQPGRGSSWSFADRFLAYFFVAPFILPAQVVRYRPARPTHSV